MGLVKRSAFAGPSAARCEKAILWTSDVVAISNRLEMIHVRVAMFHAVAPGQQCSVVILEIFHAVLPVTLSASSQSELR
jgi:hypothetical protein